MARMEPGTGDELQLLPPPKHDDVIAETMAELKTVARDGVLQTAIGMGQVVINRLFDGDLNAWRARGGSDQSYRKLAAALARDDDPMMKISASTVSRAVGVFELEDRIGVSALKRITASHCYAVLGLPDKQQEQLLKQAEETGMTTRELETRAKALRKKKGETRGRPPLPRFQKSLHRIAKLLEDPQDSFGDLDDEHLERLEASKAQELYQMAAGMKLQLEALQEALESRVPGFSAPPDE